MKLSSGRERGLKVVFDTNILVSAWLWEGNESMLVESAELGVIHGYSSEPLIDELCVALSYPRFGLSQDEVASIRSYHLLILDIVHPEQTVNAISDDPEDNRVLECALEAKTDYIVSGDNHLLGLVEFSGIKIVKAAELLQALFKQ